MALGIGSKFGSYEVVTLVGRGGMGEVYRAHDSKLKRDVAIKILPQEFSRNPERISRLQREAQVLAALNHSRIAGIYDLYDDGESRFLVLEYAEGETLAERLKRGPLIEDEALQIGLQICEALEAAHEKGIIHRDLKPANVKITPSGDVKVLDFGLAKAIEPEGGRAELSQSSTLSLAATQAGILLGTAGYMSPEQAKGFVADHRSDIFAFGAVLFEMLTGKAAFEGETVSDVLAAVLAHEPNLSTLPSTLDSRLRTLLQRCLSKNPRRRWQAAGDIRLEIESIQTTPNPAGASPAARTSAVSFKVAVIALAAALVIAIGVFGALLWRDTAVETLPIHVTVSPPEKHYFSQVQFAMSPDGRRLAFIGIGEARRVWVYSLETAESTMLAGTDDANFPFWSPDGWHIGFTTGDGIKRIDPTGGPPQTLARQRNTRGGAWNSDGVILFGGEQQGIYRVNAGGGNPSPVTKLDAEREEISHIQPRFLSGGKAFLFLAISRKPENTGIYARSLDTEDPKFLVATPAQAEYVNPGYLLFVREGVLLAQPFDMDRRSFTGDSIAVVNEISVNFQFGNGALGRSETHHAIYKRAQEIPGVRSASVGPPANGAASGRYPRGRPRFGG